MRYRGKVMVAHPNRSRKQVRFPNVIERARDLDDFLDGLALIMDRALAALCRLEMKEVA